MDWQNIRATITKQRAEFEKSLKCLNKTAPISKSAKLKHFRVLVTTFNTVRQIVIDNLGKCDLLQSIQLKDVIQRLKESLLHVIKRHDVKILVPNTLNFAAVFDESALLEPDTEPESTDFKDPMTSKVSKIPKTSDPVSSDSNTDTKVIEEKSITMPDESAAQRAYIKEISQSVPEFDGKKNPSPKIHNGN